MYYVALLRAINVGGNNTIGMKELAAACDELGWKAVRTYLNSGNVIFQHPGAQPATLAAALRQKIYVVFGLAIEVLVKSQVELDQVLAVLPADWHTNNTMRCDVVFLWDDIDSLALVNQLCPRDGVDDVRTAPGVVIWKVDRTNAARSGLMKLVGTAAYKRTTIRTSNTVRRLHSFIQPNG